MSLIEVKSVKQIYSHDGVATEALSGVSFVIEKGAFVAIMGPSGSGKSTLLHILGFLEKPSHGQYWFAGKTYDDYTQKEIAATRNEKMGFVFQAFNLLARTSVLQNVKLPLLYSKVSEKEWEKRVFQAIEWVGLGHRLHHEPSKLSGGEKQRVAIARALINDPEIIFADEPTGNLDSKAGQNIVEILTRLNKEKGRTIVLITHEPHIARAAERIIYLRDGVIERDEKRS